MEKEVILGIVGIIVGSIILLYGADLLGITGKQTIGNHLNFRIFRQEE